MKGLVLRMLLYIVLVAHVSSAGVWAYKSVAGVSLVSLVPDPGLRLGPGGAAASASSNCTTGVAMDACPAWCPTVGLIRERMKQHAEQWTGVGRETTVCSTALQPIKLQETALHPSIRHKRHPPRADDVVTATIDALALPSPGTKDWSLVAVLAGVRPGATTGMLLSAAGLSLYLDASGA